MEWRVKQFMGTTGPTWMAWPAGRTIQDAYRDGQLYTWDSVSRIWTRLDPAGQLV